MPLSRHIAMLALALGLSAPVLAAPPGLVGELRHGGYVLLMRHASSPANPPDKAMADPENTGLERQLDEKGRATAKAMGDTLRRLRIPVGPVFSSPTYRARETVRLLGLRQPVPVPELGDQGQSMARITGGGPVAWLKNKVAEPPPPGQNVLLVTHMPNIVAAFPHQASGLKDGETLVFKPDGHGHADLVAKVEIEEWPKMSR
jgi:phosphohistidine phosphatase SixA